MYPILAENPQTGFCSSSKKKHTLCYSTWMKEERTAGATSVRNILFSLGFGYVWLEQGLGCDRAFISVFKQRLTDIYKQEWSASILQKDMYAKYRGFKTLFESEGYFEFVDIKCFRDQLVKLRLGFVARK